jgi:hypothetical protein
MLFCLKLYRANSFLIRERGHTVIRVLKNKSQLYILNIYNSAIIKGFSRNTVFISVSRYRCYRSNIRNTEVDDASQCVSFQHQNFTFLIIKYHRDWEVRYFSLPDFDGARRGTAL